MRLILLVIVCVFVGGDKVSSSAVRRGRGSGHRLYRRRARFAGRAARPTRPTRHDSVLLDFYQEWTREGALLRADDEEEATAPPPVFRRQGGRRKTTRKPVVSSEEARYGMTLFMWRGPPGGARLESYVYDPTAGYEPYWLNGHWVIKGENVTTTLGPNCIYSECPPPYVNFGPVCGMEHNLALKSFDTYCDMLLADCNYEKQYTMIYRGACKMTEWETYGLKWLKNETLFISTAHSHIREYYANSPTTLTWTHHSTKKSKRRATTFEGPDLPRT